MEEDEKNGTVALLTSLVLTNLRLMVPLALRVEVAKEVARSIAATATNHPEFFGE